MRRVFLLFVMFAFSIVSVFSQRVVTGTVTNNEDGEGLPGVTVIAKGTSEATMTDLSGAYSINVPEGTTKLIFSFVGFVEVEKDVADVVNVILKSDTEIEEVVVTAVGISRDTKAIGYSIATVKNEEIEQKSEPDLLRNLNGKVAGVNIAGSSGAPGSATRITIRGNSSFYGNNQPLIVVDGIPYSNTQFNSTSQSVGGGAVGTSFSTLDPNDIKSINVLKGSAAAALYGSRAGNGVILIETKSGSSSNSKKGLEISYTTGYSVEEISNLPEYQNKYGPGTNFEYHNYNGSWGAAFDTRDSIPVWQLYKDAFPDIFTSDSVAYVAQPNNVKNLFKQGKLWENSLSITGGDGTNMFNLVASTSTNDGYIPQSSFDRNSISFGGATKLSNGVRVRSNFSYSKSYQSGGMFGNNQAIADETASSFARNLWLARNWIITEELSENPATGASVTPNVGQFDNPFWSWNHAKSLTSMGRIVANVGLSYDFLEKFNLSFTGGANIFKMDRKEYIDKGSKAYAGKGGIIADGAETQELEATTLLTFEDDITDVFNLKIILGHNINQRTNDRQAYQGVEFVVDDVFDIDNTKDVVAIGGSYSQRRLFGVFTDISLGFKRYLFLNLGYRHDWSSTLPVAHNNYPYPSVSGSFLITDAFGIQSKILNLAKLRAGWAMTGNDTDPYNTTDYYDNRGGAFPFLDQTTMYIPNITYSQNLMPETSKEMEFGFNLIMFDKRVDLDFTYYNKLSEKQIVGITVPGTSGYTTLLTNSGVIRNNGFEVMLNIVPLRTKSGFTWNINTTFTQNDNIIEEIPDGYDRILLAGVFGDPTAVFEEGKPYGLLRGTVAARDNNGNLLIDRNTGQVIPAIDPTDIGDPNPDFVLGMGNSLSWKGIGFSFQLSYKQGGDLFSNSLISMLGRGVTKDTEDREHTYIIPGVYGDVETAEPLLDFDGNTIENVTQVDMNALTFSSGTGASSFAINGVSEFGIYDATVFRLSQIAFTYAVPKKILKKTFIGAMSLSITGNNLWYYAPNVLKYSNLDPELNTYGASNLQGIEYSAAPSVRRFGATLKITF